MMLAKLCESNSAIHMDLTVCTQVLNGFDTYVLIMPDLSLSDLQDISK
jgi:hypothetical protein